jgi:hypothetical protein
MKHIAVPDSETVREVAVPGARIDLAASSPPSVDVIMA